MAITHELITTNGEYTSKDGQAKTRFHKCGVAMLNSKGETSIFIESLPTNFTGWITLKVPKPRDGDMQYSKPAPDADFDKMENDIPF